MRTTFVVLFSFHVLMVFSQPFNDPYGVAYWHLPSEKRGNTGYWKINLTGPINLDTVKKEKLLFLPSIEHWNIHSTLHQKDISLYSTTLPIALNFFSADLKHEYFISAIIRSNSSQFRFNGNVFQLGGAFLYKHRFSEKIRANVGFYINDEFYKNFYWTFLGSLEWKINDKWMTYGELPGSFKIVCKPLEKFVFGLSYKANNSSYRLAEGTEEYVRVKDLQFSLLGEYFLFKEIALIVEAGHTLDRKIISNVPDKFSNLNGNGLVFKTALYYRLPNDKW